VKSKISVTVEHSLVEFLDSLPGESRSWKIEQALRKLQRLVEEKELRAQLLDYQEDDAERLERKQWESAVAETMWDE